MTAYERIKLTLEHKKADRVPIALAWPWKHTVERWHNEGMPQDVDAEEFFGIDDVIDKRLQVRARHGRHKFDALGP